MQDFAVALLAECIEEGSLRLENNIRNRLTKTLNKNAANQTGNKNDHKQEE